MNSVYNKYSKYVTNNKKQIQLSKTCTCIECAKTFPSTAVKTFVYANSTGICPLCESDLLIPDFFVISDKLNFIKKIHDYIIDNSDFSDNEHKQKKKKT